MCFNTSISKNLKGDSGGPLSCKGSDDRWYLLGIVADGEGCNSGVPAYYLDVTKFLRWIKEAIKILDTFSGIFYSNKCILNIILQYVFSEEISGHSVHNLLEQYELYKFCNSTFKRQSVNVFLLFRHI